MRWRTWQFSAVALFALVVVTLFVARHFAISAAERQLMTPYKNGTDTPGKFGAPYTHIWIDSAGRKLEAFVVAAPVRCSQKVAVLVFHGRGETISGWSKAQAFLSQNCLSSLVFDYSGFGSSTPPAHIATLDADAVAAYNVFVDRFGTGWRRCILGHSMGNAPMLQEYSAFRPVPDCVVVANAFSSVEDMAKASGAPAPLAVLLRGVWDNADNIKAVSVPLLVIHSDADQTIPPAVSKRLVDAAPPKALRIQLHGFEHNALFRNPDLKWWSPVLVFLNGTGEAEH